MPKVFKQVQTICPCCMGRHVPHTAIFTERSMFMGVLVEYEAEYMFCNREDVCFVDEAMSMKNYNALKNAYGRRELI